MSGANASPTGRSNQGMKPSAETVGALRRAIRGTADAHLRELALLTLNLAGDADPATLQLALADSEPQVRRLAVIALKQWRDDPSYIVRYEALRVAGNCERAAAALQDESDHVVLLAIDQLGNGCDSATLEKIIDNEKDWRRQARALVSLAKVNPAAARQRLGRFQLHERFQVRVYAALAAKVLKDERVLETMTADRHPNVVEAAITNPENWVRALRNTDYGLVYAAARALRGWANGAVAVPQLLAALDRITAEKKATSRDPRTEILQRLREFGSPEIAGRLRPLLSDFDPVIARLAAEIITQKTGTPVEPQTKRYATPPLPADGFIQGLFGATAHVRMRETGSFTMQLYADEAPVTAATFAQLAEKGYYNGLTIHRIVPNFVLQGGSPGANEYVGQGDFMRDEIGLLSHVRGTLGISTRGRDTGDAQIFINLIDNFRLDHNYTVFAKITEGMENVDRIQEGDVIESIEIRRKVQPQ
ncbi:MAG: peptidylprolyl isomerase [Acidobacteria bacterium]|nr:peptidylprolyl isomerase [Acidobacteriota bacterium]